jgi:hypothetical protein
MTMKVDFYYYYLASLKQEVKILWFQVQVEGPSKFDITGNIYSNNCISLIMNTSENDYKHIL